MTSDNRSQQVGLGCGTLIVIALIVFFLGNRGTDDIEREVQGLRGDVVKLKESVEGGTAPSAKPSVDTPAATASPNLDLDRLQSELREMRKTLDAQTEQLKLLQEALERLAPAAPPFEPAPTDPAP